MWPAAHIHYMVLFTWGLCSEYCPLGSGNITVLGIKALKQICPFKVSIFHWKSLRTKTSVPYIEIIMYYSWELEKRKTTLKTGIWITLLHLYSSWRLFLPLFKKCFTVHKETACFWWMRSFQSKYKSQLHSLRRVCMCTKRNTQQARNFVYSGEPWATARWRTTSPHLQLHIRWRRKARVPLTEVLSCVHQKRIMHSCTLLQQLTADFLP